MIIKGGLWKNTEDEVLKAAVMKYGLNQWSRISSLLVRKTPKQCKARWYEWLDPAIKKADWSREEEEKLLHMAKLMPTQWRTIAPIVGRTANQCLERYQQLLEDAEQRQGIKAPTADDLVKLRHGEIDPTPELKPALPDTVDLDDDEREMLMEARARMANTQGKKARRKERERQTAETKRYASVMKRRDLLAAGQTDAELPRHLKKGQRDWNNDPIEREVPTGLFDVQDESERVEELPLGQIKFGGKSKDKMHSKEQQNRDKRKSQPSKQSGEQQDDDAMLQSTLEEAERQQILKRRKLNLPAPQIGEEDVDQLMKIGTQAVPLDAVPVGAIDQTITPGSQLKVDNSYDHGSQSIRNHFTLIDEESTQFAKQEAAISDGDYQQDGGGRYVDETEGVLGEDDIQDYTDALEFQQAQIEKIKRDLVAGFAALPKPRDDYEIVIDDLDSGQVQLGVDGGIVEPQQLILNKSDRDQTDISLQAERQRQILRDIRQQWQSQVGRLDLPIPVYTDLMQQKILKLAIDGEENVNQLIQLIREDALGDDIPQFLYDAPRDLCSIINAWIDNDLQ
ncbi:hypothetical protein MP228_002788 [Amoeboaphelidium protococcarum]|nr:hypothetical protein MP228_002788 [Amoeboaphelidium protococcarum]